MKTSRTIKYILYAQPYDMGAFSVRQLFPSAKAEQVDPFLLLHHADVNIPTHIDTKQTGVGPHPHRGFSPVTFIFKGGVHHRDSRGNDNIVYEGGAQWMNAGMGVVHSERPPHNIHEIGGRQEIIQLWVNTPAKHKMDIPVYFPLTAEQIPSITSEDGLVKIKVIAGNLNNVPGPAPTQSPVNTFTAELKKGGKYFFPIPPSHNSFVYLLDGKITVAGNGKIEGKYAAVFSADGEGLKIEATENTRLFIGSGEPLNEPLASHGPFVMNTQTEIMEAFKDYQLGKMGVLIEE